MLPTGPDIAPNAMGMNSNPKEFYIIANYENDKIIILQVIV